MDGRRIGYFCASSFDQNPDRQLEAVFVARVFTDKASDKDTQCPELDRLPAFVSEIRCRRAVEPEPFQPPCAGPRTIARWDVYLCASL
jgi:hypothetical protein